MSTSRLTGVPGEMSPKCVSRSVSGINATSKLRSPRAATVRLTPSTAIEPFMTIKSTRSSAKRIPNLRPLPSGRTHSTTPTPSTWPCTKWPPSRSPARMARSTFTRSPVERRPMVVRDRVSGETTASNHPSPRSVAVRQTPSIATLSPAESSEANGASTRSRTSSPRRSRRTTRPVLSTRPVNISITPGEDQRPLDPEIPTDGTDPHVPDVRRVPQPSDPSASEHGQGAASAQDAPRHEQNQTIGHAGVEHGAQNFRAALHQHACDPAPRQLPERPADADLAFPARHIQHQGPGVLQSAAPPSGRSPERQDDRLGTAILEQPRPRRRAQPRVQDDAHRARPARPGDPTDPARPRRQSRAVPHDGVHTDQAGVVPQPEVARRPARLRGRDQLRFP